MTAGSSDTARSASRCTSLTSTDWSRAQGLLGSSAEDDEARCERLSPMLWEGSTLGRPVLCPDSSCEGPGVLWCAAVCWCWCGASCWWDGWGDGHAAQLLRLTD